MTQPQVRPIAICLFARDNKILVAEGRDDVKGEAFYRPLGGGIEFGETAAHTIARELREEIGAEVAELRFLFAMENIFVFNGAVGHEIVLVYDGALADAELYDQARILGQEDNSAPFVAVWKALAEFGPGGDTLYPSGLWERLQAPLRA